MPVTRTYRCDEGHTFDYFHAHRDDPYPACQQCAGAVKWQPGSFAITTARSKAIDIAQSVAEHEYGMTDLRDNQREGDIAAPKVSVPHTAEVEALAREMKAAQEQATQAPDAPPQMNVNQFWQAAAGQPLGGGDPAAYVAPGSSEARAMGVDPVSLVEKAKGTGNDRMKFQVLAKGNG